MSTWKSQTDVLLCPDLMLLLPDEVGPQKKCEEAGSTARCQELGKWLAPSKGGTGQRWAQGVLFEHEQVGGRSGRAGTGAARKDRNGPSKVSWTNCLSAVVTSARKYQAAFSHLCPQLGQKIVTIVFFLRMAS